MKRSHKETIQYFIILAALVAAYGIIGRTAAGIAAAVLAVYAVLAAAVTLLSGRGISAELRAPAEMKKGQSGEVSLTLKNSSAFPVFRCGTRLEIKNLLTGEESFAWLSGGIFSKKTKVIASEAGSAVCGMLNVQISDTEVSDPLRIFTKKVRLEKNHAEILVLPELEPVDLTPEKLERYDMESFKFAEGRTGTDTSETVGIRDYMPGDNIRSIHWKLSAKTGNTVIKEPGLPVDNKLMILADKKIPEEGMTPEQIDRLTRTGLSVSCSLAKKELKHTFGWYDKERNEFITKQITVPDDVFALMPEFLSAAWAKDSRDVCERFLVSEAEKNYASYLVITQNEENCTEGAERLRNYGYVEIYRPQRPE